MSARSNARCCTRYREHFFVFSHTAAVHNNIPGVRTAPHTCFYTPGRHLSCYHPPLFARAVQSHTWVGRSGIPGYLHAPTHVFSPTGEAVFRVIAHHCPHARCYPTPSSAAMASRMPARSSAGVVTLPRTLFRAFTHHVKRQNVLLHTAAGQNGIPGVRSARTRVFTHRATVFRVITHHCPHGVIPHRDRPQRHSRMSARSGAGVVHAAENIVSCFQTPRQAPERVITHRGAIFRVITHHRCTHHCRQLAVFQDVNMTQRTCFHPPVKPPLSCYHTPPLHYFRVFTPQLPSQCFPIIKTPQTYGYIHLTILWITIPKWNPA